MTRRKRRVLIGLGSVFGIIFIAIIAAGIFIATLDQNDLKRYASAAVSKATGRQLTIEGDLDIDLGWVPKVRASEIQFENASWSSHPQMFELGLLDVEIDLWQILKGRLVLPTVILSQPKVILEKNNEGKANWEFRASEAMTEPATPEDRTGFPVIEKLIIQDGSLIFDNQETGAKFDLRLSQAEAEGFLDAPVKLKARGAYQSLPLNVSLEGGSYQNLRSGDEPYPLRLDLRVGNTRAKINGNLTEPLEMKGEDVTLDIQGDDLADLFPVIRVVFPSTPPYRLAGHLKRGPKVWSFSNFKGRVGDSDLSGTIQVDTGRKRNFMKADLVSNLLDFDDLAGFVGGNPDPEETASTEQRKKAAAKRKSKRVFPDEPYNLERLNAMDADVRLRAKRILAPKLPIDNLDAKLNLKDGVLRFEPAAFGAANGRLELYSTFDASQRPSKVDIDLRLQKLELKRLFEGSAFAEKSLGPIGGRIVISGNGESFSDLMGTSSGNMFFAMSGGVISGLLVELAGLDVAQTLGNLVRGDQSIPVRCAVLDLHGKEGQMGVRTFVFDTSDTIVFGEGRIDLKNEKPNIILTPVPKDFSPLSLRSFIRVGGSFKDPSVFPDPMKTGTDTLLQKIINVLVTLGLSPLQPRDLGWGKDINCNALIDSIQKKYPQAEKLIGGRPAPEPQKEPTQTAAVTRPRRERDRERD